MSSGYFKTIYDSEKTKRIDDIISDIVNVLNRLRYVYSGDMILAEDHNDPCTAISYLAAAVEKLREISGALPPNPTGDPPWYYLFKFIEMNQDPWSTVAVYMLSKLFGATSGQSQLNNLPFVSIGSPTDGPDLDGWWFSWFTDLFDNIHSTYFKEMQVFVGRFKPSTSSTVMDSWELDSIKNTFLSYTKTVTNTPVDWAVINLAAAKWVGYQETNLFHVAFYLSASMTYIYTPQASGASPLHIIRLWSGNNFAGLFVTSDKDVAFGTGTGPSTYQSPSNVVETLGIDLSKTWLIVFGYMTVNYGQNTFSGYLMVTNSSLSLQKVYDLSQYLSVANKAGIDIGIGFVDSIGNCVGLGFDWLGLVINTRYVSATAPPVTII